MPVMNGSEAADEDDISIDLLEIELFLDRLDGKKELAAKIIGIFLQHYMGKQAAIKQAIDDKDPEALHASAHSFKGMLVHFCRQGTELAYKLETMGGTDKIDMKRAIATYDNLKVIVDQIVPKLKEYEHGFQDQK